MLLSVSSLLSPAACSRPWASCFLLQRPGPTLLTIRRDKGLLHGAKVVWEDFILPLASSEKFNFQKGKPQNHSLSFPDKAVETAVWFVAQTANVFIEGISLGACPPWPNWFLGRRALLTWSPFLAEGGPCLKEQLLWAP